MKRLIVVLAGTWVILLLTINAVGLPLRRIAGSGQHPTV